MSYEQTDQDLLYIEDGYLTPDGYYVYIALGQVAIGPYIEDLYIDAGYYEDYSAVISLTCAADVVSGEVVEASGTWTAAFTQTATVIRIQDAESAQASAFTQSASAGRILEVSAAFTDAFTPTLTVTAFKNHTAVLDVLASVVTTPVVNRAASITLDTIGNLNSQAVKTVDILSTQTSTTNQSTNGTITTDLAQNLSANASITAEAFNVQFGQAAFSSTANIFASRNFGTGRPRSFTTNGTTAFTTSSKFGSHALTCSTGGDNHVAASATPDYNRWRTIDVWINTTAPGGGGGFGIARTSVWELGLRNQATPGGYRIRFDKIGGGNAQTAVLSDTGWVHLRLIREASAVTLYVNGVKQTWSSNTITSTDLTATNETLKIGNTATINNTEAVIDELLITNNLLNTSAASTITVPTAAWTFDNQSTVLILSHFNNVNDDDVSINQFAVSNQTASASLTAQANANTKQGAGSLTSTATVTATVTRIIEFTATEFTVFTVPDIKAHVKHNGVASFEQGVFTQSTEGQRVRYFDATALSLFTPSVSVNAQLAGVALLESNFVQSTQAHKTTDVISAHSATTTVTAQITLTAGFSSALAAESNQSTDIIRIRSADSTQSTQATLDIVYTVLEAFGSNITAEFSQTVTEQRIRPGNIAMASTADQTTQAQKTTDVISAQGSEFNQSTVSVRIRFFDTALSASMTVSVQAEKTTDIISNQSTEFSQTTQAVKSVTAVIAAGSLFTPSIDATLTARPTIQLESQFTQTAAVGTIKTLDRNYLGIASLDTITPRIGPLSGQTTFGTDIQTVGFVSSVWARRRSVGDHYAVLWSPYDSSLESFPTYRTALIIDGDDVRLRSTFDADEPGAVWEDSAPQDTDWHHYFMTSHRNTQANGPARFFRLWIDGVYKGEQSYVATMQGNVFINGGYLRFGQGTPRTIEDESWLAGTQEYLDFAQIWVGLVNTQSITPGGAERIRDLDLITEFYDSGFIDLGADGRGSLQQLPAPRIYSTLGTPYTDVNFVNSSGISQPAQPALTSLFTPTAQAQTTLTVTPSAVLLVQVQAEAEFTLTAQISYSIFEDAALSSTATVQAQAQQFIGIISNQTATVSVTADIAKITGYSADINAVATIQAVIGLFENGQSAMTATAELVCDFENIPPTRGEAALLSQFTVTADVTSFTDSVTLMVSFGELTVDATLIPPIRAEAQLNTEFTVTATIGAIEQFAVLTVSAGTMTIAAAKRVGVIATVSSEFTETAIPSKFHGIAFTVLQSEGFQLAVGDIINIDPYLTLIIPAETRALRILPENRIFTLAPESRVLYINKRTQL